MKTRKVCDLLLLLSLLSPAICLAQSVSASPELPAPSMGSDARRAAPGTGHCHAIATGKNMGLLAKVCEFSQTYLRELPDFVCQQTTTEGRGQYKTTMNAQITFRSGTETLSNISVNGEPPKPGVDAGKTMAFYSRGEFGSFLIELFRPPIVAEFKFDKEVKLGATPAAIYGFDVPAAKSFFIVQDHAGHVLKPEIRGQIWVERATGRLLKVDMQPVHMPAKFEVSSIHTTTDYFLTSLGDAGVFVLPIKSETDVCSQKPGALVVLLTGEVAPGSELQCTNNVLMFHNCHKFAATAHIVPETAATSAETSAASTAQGATLSSAQPAAPQPSATLPASPTAQSAPPSSIQPIAPQPSATLPASATAQSAAPASVQPVPPQPSAARTGQSSAEVPAEEATNTTIKVKVNLVQVRAVVLDAQGHAVGNLKKEDFQLFDDGKPQIISKFAVEKAETQPAISQRQPSGETTRQKPAMQPASGIPQRYIAYLFDDLHVQPGDLAQARAAAERNLRTLEPTDRAAIFTTSGQGQLDFTDDQKKLREAMDRLVVRPISGRSSADCPRVSYYMADQIENKHDAQLMQLVIQDALDCAFSSDPTMLRAATSLARSAVKTEAALGSRETRVSLDSLKDAAQRIADRPGQRHIILVSPGFINPEQMQEQMAIADKAVHSGVVISAIDARGLYTDTAYSGDGRSPNHTVAAATMQYQQAEAAADSDVLAELAYSTGGTFIHNTNDLEGGIRRLAMPAEYSYMLGFSPQDMKYDGKFHHLQLKVKAAEELTVQARKGYYAPGHEADPAEQAKQEIHDEVFSYVEVQSIPMQMHTQLARTAGNASKLAILIQVDVRHLHYRKVDGRNQNNLTVVSALFDRNGNYVSGNEQVLKMDWKDETLESQLDSGVTLKSELEVRPGSYLVRMVVRDENGQLATQNGEIEIP